MSRATVLTAAAAAALTGAVVTAVPAHAVHEGIDVVGLTRSNRLVRFEADRPGSVSPGVKVTGLADGERLVGIDYRPSNDALYGLARNESTGAGRLYVVDDETGVATGVGAGGIALVGSDFDIDVNPTVDRIRVVSDAGQNLRLHPDTGALAATDKPLAYAAADRNAGRTPSVVGAAYTNNDNTAAGTTLYDIDAALDVLARQVPPNDGVLNTVGDGLGVGTGDDVGFDIYNEGTTNVALASLDTGSRSRLYVVNLTTGAAVVSPTSGLVIGSNPSVVDIAIPTDQ